MEAEKQIKEERKLYEVLDELVYGRNGKFTVGELAKLLDLSDSTVYRKCTGDRPITLYEFIALAKAYAQRGEFALVNLVVPEGYVLTPSVADATDGKLDDEIKEIVEDLGAISKKFDSGDKKGALRALPLLKQDVLRVEKEIVS